MISIQTEDVDMGALIEGAKQPGAGAIVVFDGIVRDDDIREMELEAYRGVAEKELAEIAAEATEKFQLLGVDIVHRVGKLRVGENILVIIVGAGHRQEAYQGSRFIIERIKAGVPIWKKEIRRDGSIWIEGDHR
jgi:molybdopterin synthase catalytic subunit